METEETLQSFQGSIDRGGGKVYQKSTPFSRLFLQISRLISPESR